MSGRGSRKRGRPPKTPNDRVTNRRASYKLLKKPKYLGGNNDSPILSTPSVSRASTPQESDYGNSNRLSSSRKILKRSRGRGRGRASNANTSYTQKRSEFH